MTDLFFRERGTGDPLILIHGFPFHLGIWEDYQERLSDEFRVIMIDLPGFGKSPNLKAPFTLADVAGPLLNFITEKGIQKVAILGHSLGGYVALSMVEKNPSLFSALILFHSTAYADSAEKKESRSKVVEFVKKNGPLAFTSSFIPPLFANQNHIAIKKVREIASQATAEAVIGYTLAMRDRPDQIKTLERFENPTLFLAGKEDPGIPADSVLKQASHCKNPQIHIFEKVAHMGMFEVPGETAHKIKGFLLKSDTSIRLR
jgi:pimeloyl-ACP methyl ester carboxylesterase